MIYLPSIDCIKIRNSRNTDTAHGYYLEKQHDQRDDHAFFSHLICSPRCAYVWANSTLLWGVRVASHACLCNQKDLEDFFCFVKKSHINDSFLWGFLVVCRVLFANWINSGWIPQKSKPFITMDKIFDGHKSIKLPRRVEVSVGKYSPKN